MVSLLRQSYKRQEHSLCLPVIVATSTQPFSVFFTTKVEMDVFVNGTRLVCQSSHAYLVVKLDRSLTKNQNLETQSAKATAQGVLMRRLAATTRLAITTTLSTSTLALVHTPTGYYASVRCRRAHTSNVDVSITNSQRVATGCLRATKVEHLPVQTMKVQQNDVFKIFGNPSLLLYD